MSGSQHLRGSSQSQRRRARGWTQLTAAAGIGELHPKPVQDADALPTRHTVPLGPAAL